MDARNPPKIREALDLVRWHVGRISGSVLEELTCLNPFWDPLFQDPVDVGFWTGYRYPASMSASITLRATHLHSAHKALNARLVPFAGYDMPVQYTSIIAEAKAVREGAGMFDVSHMGRLTIRGESALSFLEWVTTNDVGKLVPNTGQYSLLPNERGGCVDDIILYRDEDGYQMVVNAGNHEKGVAWLKSHVPPDVTMDDVTDQTSMVAVQGPSALRILSELTNSGDHLSKSPAFGLNQIVIDGCNVQAARSGYTGEDGFELVCQAHDSEKIWDALIRVGVMPCGLGARDTLRVEAGLPLYGHELSEEMSPISAGLGWVISKSKEFVGSEKINHIRADGPPRRLAGVKLAIKRLISTDMKVLVDDREVGLVTSGVISPIFDTALALAFIDSNVELGTECFVEARGRNEPGTIVSKRFYKRSS